MRCNMELFKNLFSMGSKKEVKKIETIIDKIEALD